ncbi:hypothetical protein [Microvirga puerhi]|uniref:Protein phosphatase 2C domain-containing protein n=1 Tax=Microvirga puerhi TaxID=2876078 RepID=A0ABS7VI45_9HYPH|nr:hypothetical protein [Microvirga puerhi]MBZ6075183.1 hypothetical protein [Microvirga puerhi]
MSETGLHIHFRSLFRQSLPGSRVNEDGSGLHGPYAWIVDGATGVSDGQITSAESDAAWLAELLGAKLSALSEAGRDPAMLLKELEGEIARAFDSVGGAEESVGPSACLGLVMAAASARSGIVRLDGFFLGDVVALVPSQGGILRWTDERAKPFERRTLAALGDGDTRTGQPPEAVRRQILENRAKLNQPDGYWVVNPRRSWNGRELHFSAEIAAGAPVVLATDGFMRLVDVFGAYTDASLYDAMAAGRGSALLQELRERERGDEAGRLFRRVKTHDDATALVVVAEA